MAQRHREATQESTPAKTAPRSEAGSADAQSTKPRIREVTARAVHGRAPIAETPTRALIDQPAKPAPAPAPALSSPAASAAAPVPPEIQAINAVAPSLEARVPPQTLAEKPSNQAASPEPARGISAFSGASAERLYNELASLPSSPGYAVIANAQGSHFVIVHGTDLMSSVGHFIQWARYGAGGDAHWLRFLGSEFREPRIFTHGGGLASAENSSTQAAQWAERLNRQISGCARVWAEPPG